MVAGAGPLGSLNSRVMIQVTQTAPDYRFSGHQTFALRISWLPKAAEAVRAGRDPFTDPRQGVVELGLGKVMVESLKCWVEAFGVAERTQTGWDLTKEGAVVFGAGGLDRYLEDAQTLWWLHWKISNLRTAPFFAWELLINRWNEATFTTGQILAAFAKEGETSGRILSEVTLKQHFDVWLRTYCTNRDGRLVEDGLDCPLSGLGLVRLAGYKDLQGRKEPVYAFDLSPKRAVSQSLFLYAMVEWWRDRLGEEETVPFQLAVTGPGSPGRVFRMQEAEIRDRLLGLEGMKAAPFELQESLNQYQIRRIKSLPRSVDLLAKVYAGAAESPRRELAHA